MSRFIFVSLFFLSILACTPKTAKISVTSSSIDEISKSNEIFFSFKEEGMHPHGIVRTKNIIRACTNELRKKGYLVNDKIYSKSEWLNPEQILVFTVVDISDGELSNDDQRTNCYSGSSFTTCATNKSDILYRKIVVLKFAKFHEEKISTLHQLNIVTMSPNQSLSMKTANEMCRVAFQDFPNNLDSVFYESTITEED